MGILFPAEGGFLFVTMSMPVPGPTIPNGTWASPQNKNFEVQLNKARNVNPRGWAAWVLNLSRSVELHLK